MWGRTRAYRRERRKRFTHMHLKRTRSHHHFLAASKAIQQTRHQTHHYSFSSYETQKPDANSTTQALPTSSTHPAPSINLTTHVLSNKFTHACSSNKMITNCIRSGDLDSALRIFENMKFRTTVTWNSILAGYSKKPGKAKEARQLFDKIPQPDAVSFNTMLACYLRNSDIVSARDFFDRILNKDIVSWNTMISGFCENGMMDEACELFKAMPEKSSVSWNAMISGYVKTGDLDLAVEMFWAAPAKSVIAWTAIVTGHMKCGKVELAEKLFNEMPVKNLVTWNAMIAGYVENCQAEEALKLFRTMLELGIKPNPSSLSSVLLACSNLSALKLGKQIHQLTCKSVLGFDTTVGTSLISMYSKCGDLKGAWILFLEIPRRDVVTWNSMISGFAEHGAGEKALSLFDEMRNAGIKPDWITFVGVLSACNHSGLVDLGIRYFDTMLRDYGIESRREHYACMVDLLGRAGKLVEAVDLIKKMPFKPHNAIFGTLLGACRIHKNVTIAEFASKNLLGLDPTSADGYVQLANIYASMNNWDHVARVRRSMKHSKVIKMPAYSWIEVKSVVHEFKSGDKVHPELSLIHEKLAELKKNMKLKGYVPEL